MTTAKRRAIDQFRSTQRRDRGYAELARDQGDDGKERDIVGAMDHVQDDVLRLMFICCHPSLSQEAQTTLTLKLVGGLTTAEIARAFLTTEATIAQRVVRAKRTLTGAGAALAEPEPVDRAHRLVAVRGVIYLLFNEGYSATAGEDWMRPALCDEALRLGRILATLVARDAEVQGLSALMELQIPGRRSAAGRTVSRCYSSTRIEAVGMQHIYGGASMRWSAPTGCPRSVGCTPCRPPSPPAMREPARPMRPTGC
jgi:predicted RNA polymerase sigma factor